MGKNSIKLEMMAMVYEAVESYDSFEDAAHGPGDYALVRYTLGFRVWRL